MRKKSKGDTWDGIFADPEVGRVLKARGLIADANRSSIEELASITSLNPGGSYDTGYFYNNTVITKFPELKYCTGITSLMSAFRGCSNLTEVGTIPDSVTDMTGTFNGCSSLLEAPIIPEGVTTLAYTFNNCTNLTEAPIIPESVTNMIQTFRACSRLIEAPTIPISVTNMDSTFMYCSNLIEAPIIPEGVTTLAYTFYNCSNLTEAPIIPSNVTNMKSTFYECRSLNGIFIIKPINPPTFSSTFYKVNVRAIYVPDESVDSYKNASGWSEFASNIYPMSDYWDGVFADPEVGRVLHANGLIADANKSSIEELSQITTLGEYFNYNNIITQFPELKYCTGVTNMSWVFNGCSSLVNAPIIPESVTNMDNTFASCTSLVNAPVIPDGVTSMLWTFGQCTSLVNAPIIPNSVTNMDFTFIHCWSLDGIFRFKPVTPPTYDSTLLMVNVVIIYVPDESVDIYKSTEGWSGFADNIYPMSELPE